LRTVTLRKANLTGAHLEGAVLTGARLEEADLTGAHVETANFAGAHLEGAILVGVSGLTWAQLADATIDETTILPAHVSGTRVGSS
jgi:uncharacterized protein YjbI with pentapeptide repeats